MQIEQHSKVEYLGCLMDEMMSGEAMELNVIHKINNKLKFWHCKKKNWHQNWDTLFAMD